MGNTSHEALLYQGNIMCFKSLYQQTDRRLYEKNRTGKYKIKLFRNDSISDISIRNYYCTV